MDLHENNLINFWYKIISQMGPSFFRVYEKYKISPTPKM